MPHNRGEGSDFEDTGDMTHTLRGRERCPKCHEYWCERGDDCQAVRQLRYDKHAMEGASWVSRASKDPTTKVGCLLIGPDREPGPTGYNGIPRDVKDLHERMERPAKYLWTAHAEENAVAHAARMGVCVKGYKAYVTHPPCARCARMLIQAGIVEVIVGTGTTSMPEEEFKVAQIMFKEAGVKYRVFE